jgi:uncharacterized protein (DUF2267 family)
MSGVGLKSTVQSTHIWINDLDSRLGWDDKHRSYRLLRAVLQALRDWLMVDEAAGFGAQLPELLRGVYYEHWRPATTPVKKRRKADFIARIDDAFKADPIVSATRVPCLSSCPKRSRPMKFGRYIMPCRPASERFGRFLHK